MYKCVISKCLIHIVVYQMVRVCNQINATGVTSGARTAYPSGAPEFTPSFQWDSCYWIFSFICMFCKSLFVVLYVFFQPLCCLFFFDIRILNAPLVSSNSSQLSRLINNILVVPIRITISIIQSILYQEVTFGTKSQWPFKTGDLLKEVKFT